MARERRMKALFDQSAIGEIQTQARADLETVAMRLRTVKRPKPFLSE
jgi:hypothetical protein